MKSSCSTLPSRAVPTLRFHTNPETDKALATASANASAATLQTLQALHIPSLAWAFASIHKLDQAHHLQEMLDGARQARAGRGAAAPAKPSSAAERRAMRAEIAQLRSDAQPPTQPKRIRPEFVARRLAALQAAFQHYRCIERRIAAQNRGLEPSVESNPAAQV